MMGYDGSLSEGVIRVMTGPLHRGGWWGIEGSERGEGGEREKDREREVERERER